MAKVAHNFLANLGGTTWGILVAFAVVPFYLKFIGAEGYGLVGFFSVLSALLSVFDAGFSGAASRELARSSEADAKRGDEIREMVYVLERLFLGAALAIGMAVVALAPWIATRWLNVQDLSAESATHAVRLMGALLALQLPLSLYNGCLLGLQRHVLLNAVGSGISTVRSVGAVLVLWLVSPTVEAFFLWQVAAMLASLFISRWTVWRLLPGSGTRIRFRLEQVRKIGPFAAEMATTNLLGLILSQLDKAVLSVLLPLHLFGYYMLAWTLATVTYRLAGPLFLAILPRMTQLSSAGEAASADSLFQRSGQVMALLVVPFSLFVATFAEEILLLWTHNPEAARAGRWVAALLAIGTMISAIMHVPYATYVAEGRLRPIIAINVVAILLMVPMLVLLTRSFGATGAAASWALLNAGMFVAMVLMARRRVGDERVVRWLVSSAIAPVVVCALFFSGAKGMLGDIDALGSINAIAILAAIGISAELLLAAFLPFARQQIAGVARLARRA